jgi:hypothetical protein
LLLARVHAPRAHRQIAVGWVPGWMPHSARSPRIRQDAGRDHVAQGSLCRITGSRARTRRARLRGWEGRAASLDRAVGPEVVVGNRLNRRAIHCEVRLVRTRRSEPVARDSHPGRLGARANVARHSPGALSL